MLKTHFPQPNPPLYISNCAPPIQVCERQTLRAGLRGGATANAGTATGIDRGGGGSVAAKRLAKPLYYNSLFTRKAIRSYNMCAGCIVLLMGFTVHSDICSANIGQRRPI